MVHKRQYDNTVDYETNFLGPLLISHRCEIMYHTNVILYSKQENNKFCSNLKQCYTSLAVPGALAHRLQQSYYRIYKLENQILSNFSRGLKIWSWLCFTPVTRTRTRTTTPKYIIFYWPDFDQTLNVGSWEHLDSNCHSDICPGNISPRNICPYQEYLSCYGPDLD